MARTRKALQQGKSLNAYHSITQLRTEGWGRLKTNMYRLVEAVEQGHDHKRLLQQVQADLELLEPIDSYWAFPSRQDSDYLRGLFDHQDRKSVV